LLSSGNELAFRNFLHPAEPTSIQRRQVSSSDYSIIVLARVIHHHPLPRPSESEYRQTKNHGDNSRDSKLPHVAFDIMRVTVESPFEVRFEEGNSSVPIGEIRG
jgi:hypothetical protein